MSSSSLNHLIPEFDGESYDFWYVKMKTIFRSLNQWEIVERGWSETPEDDTLTEAETKKIEQNRQADASALSILQRAVTKAIFPRIMRAETAKEAWEILQSEFQGDAKVREIKLHALLKEFENLKMNENETLMEFSTRIFDLSNQMKVLGEDVTDKRLVRKILICLPEKYDAIVAVIEETKDLSTLTVQEVMSSLKSYQQRLMRHSDKSIEGAFQSKLNISGPSSSRPKQGRNNKNQGRNSSLANRGSRVVQQTQNNSRSNNNNSQCSNCNKSGHIEDECWFKGQSRCSKCKRFGHQTQDCRSGNKYRASQVESNQSSHDTFFVCHNVVEQNNNKWLLDSGCSNHMSPSTELFSQLDPSTTSSIQFGNGDRANSKGLGSIAIETKEGLSCINNVLCVPSLSQNLLSLGQMVENGYKLCFDNNECVIYDKHDKSRIFTRIKMINRSFILDIRYPNIQAQRANTQDVPTTILWHKRLGHLNYKGLREMADREMVYGLPSIDKLEHVCEGCMLGKQHRLPFPKGVASRAESKLELIHSDVCGPMESLSHGQNRYFVLFIDDYSRMTWVYFMRQKSEVFSIFKKFKSLVEKQSGCQIKTLRSDRGGEYTSKQFHAFCEDEGINRKLTVRHTPQQNGVTERKNQTIVEMGKSMLHEKGMPKTFWAEAVHTAVYLSNRCPTTAVANKTPFEAWSGRKPSVNHLKVFGSICYSQISKANRRKLDESSERCIFLGYSTMSKGYRLFSLKENQVIISRDVKIDEKASWNWEAKEIRKSSVSIPSASDLSSPSDINTSNSSSPSADNSDNSSADNPSSPSSGNSTSPSSVNSDSPSTDSPSTDNPSTSTPRKLRSISDIYNSCNYCSVEPENFTEAVREEPWRRAMEEEIDVIEKNNTWELVDRPTEKDVIKVKWIFKIKHNPDGSIQRYKARLVAKGYTQQHGVDYDETFAPVARHDTIRAIIAFAASQGWNLYQLDVKSAFLNGELKEEVYVDQPEGFMINGGENKVYKLKKALYGLKQAPRAWYSNIDRHLIQTGFEKSKSEATMYVKRQGTDVLILTLYVDDLIFTGNNLKMIEDFKTEMTEKYEMSDMGLLQHFLGMEIHQDEGSVFVSQKIYAEKILKKYKMFDCNPTSTPLVKGEKLMKEDGGNPVDETHYRSLIGNLLYLTATRPDLMFAASLLARFMAKPSHIHLNAATRVLRYIKGTTHFGLSYQKNQTPDLNGYCDSDHGGSLDDMKSTSAYSFSLGSAAFAWMSKKQQSVALSSAEAEYVSASAAASQAIWLRRIMIDFGLNQPEGTRLYCDNKAAIAMAKNPVHHSRTRHIALKHHFIRDAIEDGVIQLEFCRSEEQVADILTKALPRDQFQLLRARLGVRPKA